LKKVHKQKQMVYMGLGQHFSVCRLDEYVVSAKIQCKNRFFRQKLILSICAAILDSKNSNLP
jgi:hypothetical protein